MTFGGYDVASEKKTGQTTGVLKEAAEFEWITLRNTSIQERSYLYLSVSGGMPDATVLVDRIVLVASKSSQ